jgi:hypothetical protein
MLSNNIYDEVEKSKVHHNDDNISIHSTQFDTIRVK